VVGGAEAAFRSIMTGETVYIASVAEHVCWVTGERDIIPGTKRRLRAMSGISQIAFVHELRSGGR
jgi:hypothetical protein